MAVFEMGGTGTTLLGDYLTSTCLSKSKDLRKSETLLKVLPRRSHHFKRLFFVHVVGKGFLCSPIKGIAIFFQPSCFDQGTCPRVLRCVPLKGAQMGDLTKCIFRCQITESWDYVLVDLAAYNLRVIISEHIENMLHT